MAIEKVAPDKANCRKVGEIYEGIVIGSLMANGVDASPNYKKQLISGEYRTVGYDVNAGRRVAIEVKSRGKMNYINPREMFPAIPKKFKYTHRIRVLLQLGGCWKDSVLGYRLQRYGVNVIWLKDMTESSFKKLAELIRSLEIGSDQLGICIAGGSGMLKVCARCHVERSLADFKVDMHNRDGHSSWCNDCQRKAYMRWAQSKKGKEHLRIAQRKYKQSEKGKEAQLRGAKRYREKMKAKALENDNDVSNSLST